MRCTFFCVSLQLLPFTDHEYGRRSPEVAGLALVSEQKHLCTIAIRTCAIPCTYKCRYGFDFGAFDSGACRYFGPTLAPKPG
jgi:hypothetical protein